MSGTKHEFSTIPGAVEDVTDIILNVKKLLIKNHPIERGPGRAIRFPIIGPTGQSVLTRVKLNADEIFGRGVIVVDHERARAGLVAVAFFGAGPLDFAMCQAPRQPGCFVMIAFPIGRPEFRRLWGARAGVAGTSCAEPDLCFHWFGPVARVSAPLSRSRGSECLMACRVCGRLCINEQSWGHFFSHKCPEGHRF